MNMELEWQPGTAPAGSQRRGLWLALAGIALLGQLGGCAILRAPAGHPEQPQQPARVITQPPETTAPAGETPQPPPAPVPAPVPQPPAATRHFQLGAAATALVADAHKQAASGNPGLAINTIERALRIEPDNPLLWTELGQAHQAASHFDQAGSMGHKALQLATGDPHAQAGAWHLIADSLKARNRNPEALEAEKKAGELAAR